METNITLLLADYEEYLQGGKYMKHYAANTIKTYINHIELYFKVLDTLHYRFTSIKEKEVNEILKYAEENYAKAYNSVWVFIASVRNFYEFLKYKYIITYNPFEAFKYRPVKNANIQKIDNMILSEEEIHFILKSCKGNLRKAILLCYVFGLRISEIKNLTKDSLIDTNGVLKLKIKSSKRNDFRISVCISTKYNDEIRTILSDWDRMEINIDSLKVMANKLAKKIGKDFSFHCFRHSYATHFLDKGGDMTTLSSILGHSSTSTTMIYGKVTTSRIDALKAILN